MSAVAIPVLTPDDQGTAPLAPGFLDRLNEELDRRLLLIAQATASRKNRALTLEACAADVTLFFDDWLWTYDPRLVNLGYSPVVPFRLRPKQAEYLRWLEDRERMQKDGLVEKGRDEGFSFLTLGFMLHRWLFVDGWAGAVGSRKQDLVDAKDDPKALLPKARFMLYELPAWFLPPGFSRKEHDNFLRLINPDTGATITGEAGENMGRGGRASFYLIDEHAFLDSPEEVERATSQNSPVRIKGSTPNGVGNRFYQDRFSGKMDVFTFHWKDNPDKNWQDENGRYPWYDWQRERLDEVTIAQEVDIDYTASAEGVVIPAKWVQAALRLAIPDGAPNVSAGDLSEGGSDLTVYANRRGPVVKRVVKVPSGPDWGQAAELETLCREDGCGRFAYDRLGIGAGITATMAQKKLPFKVEGVANSESPTKRVFEDQPAPPKGQRPLTNDERFKNLAAEMWWGLRLAFKRTYERVVEGKAHPDSECISIPNDPALIAQLSQPTYSKNSAGKIVVDKKGEGTSSPDHAEAVLYLFAPEAPSQDWSGVPQVRA